MKVNCTPFDGIFFFSPRFLVLMWLSVGTSSNFSPCLLPTATCLSDVCRIRRMQEEEENPFLLFPWSSIDSKHTIPYHPHAQLFHHINNNNWWKKAYANSFPIFPSAFFFSMLMNLTLKFSSFSLPFAGFSWL